MSSNDHPARNVLVPMMMTFKDLQRNEDISSLSIEIESF